MRRARRFISALCTAVLLSGAAAATAAAQEIACSAEPAIESSHIVTLSEQQMLSWVDAPLATGGTLAEELGAYGIQMSEINLGTKVPLSLPGNVATSVYVLEGQPSRDPAKHTWVLLYSLAPDVVRAELERQGISYPWSGFVLTKDAENAAAPLRLWMLGQGEDALVYDPSARTFQHLPSLFGPDAGAEVNQGCTDCLLDLVKSVACEAVASGIACATVAGCPGAVLSALIRATWKLLTQDLCFGLDISRCFVSCAFPRITITPASNAQVNPGNQQITVSITGTNAGAWALPVPQNGSLGAPLIKLGGNPRTLSWNPAAGVYTVYAGNIPIPTVSAPNVARSTNVNVGQAATARVNWSITDACNDSRGLRVRFFDKTRGGVFPSQSTYYTVPSGGQRTFSFDAPRGSRLCLGAVKDPPNSQWWCYGIDGTRDGSYSSTCCTVVPSSGTFNPSNRLICN